MDDNTFDHLNTLKHGKSVSMMELAEHRKEKIKKLFDYKQCSEKEKEEWEHRIDNIYNDSESQD